MNLGTKPRIGHKSKQQRNNANSFDGQMQQLILNGKSYFELVENENLVEVVEHTNTFSKPDLPHKLPLTFHNQNSWIALPKIDAFHMLLIQFHFKTHEENGLILYNGGQNEDFVSIELVNGQIIYAFSLGKTINTIKSKSKEKLNDNEWHLVSVWRSSKTDHELTVDSLVYKYSSDKSKYTMFNLAEKLYIGGLSTKAHYKELNSKLKIISSTGFKGCLASIEINGRVPPYDNVLGVNGKFFGNITKGCESIYDINLIEYFQFKENHKFNF